MRSTHNAEPILMGDEFVGISLGADYCAEHEWGISGLERSLGMDTSKLGIDRRQITKGDKIGLQLVTVKKIKAAQLYTKRRHWNTGEDTVPEKPVNVPTTAGANYLSAQWDDRDFHVDAFNVEGKNGVDQLAALYEAAAKNDIALWVNGSSNPFGRGGLIMVIVSKLPQEIKDSMLKADNDAILIKKTMADTGIEEILSKANCKYYALSPRWITADSKVESKCPLLFWLNPMEQNRNNYGWYTVEDLLEWSQGKGKIPMTPEQIAKRGR